MGGCSPQDPLQPSLAIGPRVNIPRSPLQALSCPNWFTLVVLIAVLFADVYVFGIDYNELNLLASKKTNEQHLFRLQDAKSMKKAFDIMIDETDAMDMCGLNKELIDEVFNDPNTDYRTRKTLVNEKFPWIAKINITHPGTQEFCKGSILTKNFILTAAHCFHLDEDTKHIRVQVRNVSLPVKNLYRHPQFDRNAKKDKSITNTFDYDIALLELGRKISYSSTARPICIPCTKSSSWALRMKRKHNTCKYHSELDFLFEGKLINSLFVAEEDKKLMEQKHVTIKTGNARLACLRATAQVEEFKDIADIRDMVTDQFLCTGGTEPYVEPSTCKGDTGGPLIIEYKRRYIQVGIISWGSVNHCIGTKRKSAPVPERSRDFHINIFSMLPWITEIVKNELIFLPN
ncbi:complement factor B-like [Pelobates fuscus]|uniref:complement factor B-like n=1 Tax=Pelobates fuscus TaxID=191477 RepID=UPI002FE4314E